MSIAGVLMVDKMFGKWKNKVLYRCIPYNKHLPIFLVPYEEKKSFSKKKIHKYVLFEYVHWDLKHPIGQLTRTIGNVDDLACLYEYLMNGLELHISNTKFTNTFMKVYKITNHENHIHQILGTYAIEDRTHLPVYTIDGADTQDYDDAFGFHQMEKGVRCISIYISNVVLWMEHFNLWSVYGGKTTSIYIPEKTINMLPNKLTDMVCALKERSITFAFALDIKIDQNQDITHQFRNVMLKVKRNFVYDEPALLRNEDYREVSRLMKMLGGVVVNSRKTIESMMIYFNTVCGEEMARNNNGIYRFCNIDEKEQPDIPSELLQYVSSSDTKSGYGLYMPGIQHQLLGIPTYIHMTSPIRRLVDMLNMIQFQINHQMIEVSDECLQFYQSWIDKIELINERSGGIKRLEYETKLLNVYHNDPIIQEKVFEGFCLNKLTDGIYKIYLPELKISSVVKVTEDIPLYKNIKCKLYLIQDDINVVQKIRLKMIQVDE